MLSQRTRRTFTMEGDWRVALAEIIFATSIKNATTKQYFVFTPKTPLIHHHWAIQAQEVFSWNVKVARTMHFFLMVNTRLSSLL